jgi:DNA gyrase subunit A
MDIDNYRIQKRGGVGLKYAKLHESDQIRQILTLNNKDWILFFTSSGYVYRCKAYELRESESRNSRGFHVSSIVDLKEGDSIVNISSVPDFQHKHNLIFATKNGIIKKTPLAEYESHAKFLIAINLYEGDKLQSLALCNEDDEILMVTQNGKSKRYLVSSIPKRNRSAIGVIGIKFKDKDSLLSMYSISPHINKGEKQQYVLTVTSEGYVKKTSVYEYPITTSRASMGVTGCNLSEKTGKLIGALVVVNNDILISITNKSDLMRTKICEINPTRRRSSGVQLMKLKRGSHIIDITASDINS